MRDHTSIDSYVLHHTHRYLSCSIRVWYLFDADHNELSSQKGFECCQSDGEKQSTPLWADECFAEVHRFSLDCETAEYSSKILEVSSSQSKKLKLISVDHIQICKWILGSLWRCYFNCIFLELAHNLWWTAVDSNGNSWVLFIMCVDQFSDPFCTPKILHGFSQNRVEMRLQSSLYWPGYFGRLRLFFSIVNWGNALAIRSMRSQEK